MIPVLHNGLEDEHVLPRSHIKLMWRCTLCSVTVSSKHKSGHEQDEEHLGAVRKANEAHEPELECSSKASHIDNDIDDWENYIDESIFDPHDDIIDGNVAPASSPATSVSTLSVASDFMDCTDLCATLPSSSVTTFTMPEQPVVLPKAVKTKRRRGRVMTKNIVERVMMSFNAQDVYMAKLDMIYAGWVFGPIAIEGSTAMMSLWRS